MGYPYTESGRNMYDMLSLIQKSIRRGDFNHAGYAAHELKGRYRSTMWNRLYVISSEDCYGILTKEIVRLREEDEKNPTDQNLSNVLALMCSSRKSRDACYFACNFVLTSREPRIIEPSDEKMEELYCRIYNAGKRSYEQIDLFEKQITVPEELKEPIREAAALQISIKHKDMDMMGYEMDLLRRGNRDLLWNALIDYSVQNVPDTEMEIRALKSADDKVNGKRKDLSKDEIFISKAAMVLCYAEDMKAGENETILGSDLIDYKEPIDWSKYRTYPIKLCNLEDGKIPEWTYDCHTITGKKRGKTDWDMTVDEQAALHPLNKMYFDDASWIYFYEEYALDNDVIKEEDMPVIRKYAEDHPANPVQYKPY